MNGKPVYTKKVSNECKEIIQNLNDAKMMCYTSDECRNKKIGCLVACLRDQQRQEVFDESKKAEIEIEKLFVYDKGVFWKKVRRLKAEASGKQDNSTDGYPSLDEFAECYSTLFSHDDRQSLIQHKKIEEEVEDYYESLKSCTYDGEKFEYSDIREAVFTLKRNKAVGVDNISNEMFFFGLGKSMTDLLLIFYNKIIMYGYLPDDFNVALVTPIPKKGEMRCPTDFRPISVSTSSATVFELLLLKKMSFIKESSNNQFGYKNKTSCNQAYLTVTETIRKFEKDKTKLNVISLDAKKAFDKLWRCGLFYKLKQKCDPFVWRVLLLYYKGSKIKVKMKGKTSECYKTREGCKQGGILSPYLFNFFMNDLLIECLNSGYGAYLYGVNVSVIAYCDDLVLIAGPAYHMKRLLEICSSYAINWKIEFNPSKSEWISFNEENNSMDEFEISGEKIPKKTEFTYLGLPIGNDATIGEYVEKKFRKVEKAFYSLYSIGCKPNGLHPYTIGFFYKKFCQSIFRYGLESIFLNETKKKR